MKVDGKEVVLELVEKDEVWSGQFNNYYIASWDSDAPPEEIIVLNVKNIGSSDARITDVFEVCLY